MVCPAVVQGFLAIQFEQNPTLEVIDNQAIIALEFWNKKYEIILSRSSDFKGNCYDTMYVAYKDADGSSMINGTTKILEKFIRYGLGNK